MKPPAYPKYKPSGIEWLGEVPEHWEAQGVKFCYSIQLGKMLQPEPASPTDEETPYLKSQHVQWEHVRVADLPSMWTNKKERRQYGVKDGDLLVCEGGDVGRAAVVRGAPDGTIIQNALHRVRPQGENETGFLLYVLAHAASQGWFEIICNKSTIAHFTVDKFGALGVALPTPAEQRAIAAYLDWETGQVDRLVAKKRELIERLKEKRTALISRTVTRGLPAEAAAKAGLPVNPPLKPSGLDWLGDIPKHWPVMALKWRSRCRSGDSIATEDVTPEPTPERRIPVIGGNGVMGYCDTSNCNHPVLVIGRVGALCGNVHLIAPPAWITDNALVMPTDSTTFSQKFLAPVLRTRNLNELADKTAQPLITGTRVRNERVPVPPLPEQTAIAAYLDAETAKLDALVGKVEEAVERLQEYRTALITAAVTGKIDVRSSVALRPSKQVTSASP